MEISTTTTTTTTKKKKNENHKGNQICCFSRDFQKTDVVISGEKLSLKVGIWIFYIPHELIRVDNLPIFWVKQLKAKFVTCLGLSRGQPQLFLFYDRTTFNGLPFKYGREGTTKIHLWCIQIYLFQLLYHCCIYYEIHWKNQWMIKHAGVRWHACTL